MTLAVSWRRFIFLVGMALLILGLFARVAPLADIDGRLLKQWPTEDGYLMLTIARNMSLGHGMSTADGELPTNGTQPLATGIWAAAFSAVDADKKAGVTIVLLIEIGFSLLSAYLLYLLASDIYRRINIAAEWAWLSSGIWFSSSLVIPHSMNTLETGIYATLVLLAACLFLKTGETSREGSISFGWPQTLIIALVLSLCFYARNDSVFLILAFCLTGIISFTKWPRLNYKNLPKVIVAGSATVIAASPWLVSNLLNFGHLMPISGVAQSATTTFGENAHLLPIILAEYLFVILPIPASLQESSAVIGLMSLAVISATIAGLILIRRTPPNLRHFTCFILIYAVCITGYYGLIHGAPWFMARYFFPLSPFLAILTVGIAARFVFEKLPARFAPALLVLTLVFVFLLNAVTNVRLYNNGSEHMHEMVVQWVNKNVRPDDWVGAVQTGTLGFFHDRTINLDGKVNPEALEARLTDSIPDYVLEKDIDVIADWRGISAWIELPPLDENFCLLVDDPGENLGVLARCNWQPLPDNAQIDKSRIPF